MSLFSTTVPSQTPSPAPQLYTPEPTIFSEGYYEWGTTAPTPTSSGCGIFDQLFNDCHLSAQSPVNAPIAEGNYYGDDYYYAENDGSGITIALVSLIIAISSCLAWAIGFACHRKRNNTTRRQRSSTSPTPQRTPPTERNASSKEELRIKVVDVLFPEERIDNSDMKLNSEANSYRWSSEQQNKRSNTACCICLEKFGPGDLVVSAGNCSHTYHRDCVMTWVRINDDCPMCRKPMFDEEAFKAVEQQFVYGLDPQALQV